MNDPVAFQRYEYKYLIPAALIGPVCSFIAPYCDIDPYADREDEKFYTIRTLYLDTADYKTYWDKVDEVPDRFKLRIRTYGEQPGGPVKFEVKRRLDEVFQKSSVAVPENSWFCLLTRPVPQNTLAFNATERAAYESFLSRTALLGAEPKMLVKYERQAYRSRIDRYVRVSFDRRLCFEPKTGYDLNVKRAAKSLGDMVILELKFVRTAPFWLVDLVRKFELVRTGFSKYCSAVEASGRGWPTYQADSRRMARI